jgi:hypothetical protein
MKRFRWLLTFIPVILVVLWAIIPQTGIFGENFYTSTLFMVGIFVLTGIIVISTISFFIGPMLSFFGGSPSTRKILKTGRTAYGIIKGISESSMGGVITVNNQPYVNLKIEVNDGMRAPYIVSLDTIIPRLSVPAFQPGVMIPIKIDLEDHEKIAIDWARLSG